MNHYTFDYDERAICTGKCQCHPAAGDLNVQRYVSNNPLTLIDLNGLEENGGNNIGTAGDPNQGADQVDWESLGVDIAIASTIGSLNPRKSSFWGGYVAITTLEDLAKLDPEEKPFGRTGNEELSGIALPEWNPDEDVIAVSDDGNYAELLYAAPIILEVYTSIAIDILDPQGLVREHEMKRVKIHEFGYESFLETVPNGWDNIDDLPPVRTFDGGAEEFLRQRLQTKRVMKRQEFHDYVYNEQDNLGQAEKGIAVGNLVIGVLDSYDIKPPKK